MSAVPPLIRSGLFVALNAIDRPSGAHENAVTLKSLPLVRCRAGHRRAQRVLDVDRPEVGVLVVAADDLVVAEVLLAIFLKLGWRIGRGECDRLAVPRPQETGDRRLRFGQLDRFAAVRPDREDLVPIADARAREREPLRRRVTTAGSTPTCPRA